MSSSSVDQINPDLGPSKPSNPAMIDSPAPIPSTSSPHTPPSSSVVINDPRAIVALVNQLLHRSGMSDSELAKSMGIKPTSLFQYKYGYRHNPSVQWLARLAEACGARLIIEWIPR